MFWTLWMITELAQIKIFAQRVLQPVVKIKIGRHFQYKKPLVTSKFCDQNFYWMHHFEDMNILSLLELLCLFSSL